MAFLRTGSKPGTGIVSSLVGLLFIVAFFVAAASLTKLVLVEQRLNAVAADSVRRLSAGQAIGNTLMVSEIEQHVDDMFPELAGNMSFFTQRTGNLTEFRIQLSNYSVQIWPGISAGPYTLSASATSHTES